MRVEWWSHLCYTYNEVATNTSFWIQWIISEFPFVFVPKWVFVRNHSINMKMYSKTDSVSRKFSFSYEIKVLHEDSFWNRITSEPGNGLSFRDENFFEIYYTLWLRRNIHKSSFPTPSVMSETPSICIISRLLTWKTGRRKVSHLING